MPPPPFRFHFLTPAVVPALLKYSIPTHPPFRFHLLIPAPISLPLATDSHPRTPSPPSPRSPKILNTRPPPISLPLTHTHVPAPISFPFPHTHGRSPLSESTQCSPTLHFASTYSYSNLAIAPPPILLPLSTYSHPGSPPLSLNTIYPRTHHFVSIYSYPRPPPPHFASTHPLLTPAVVPSPPPALPKRSYRQTR